MKKLAMLIIALLAFGCTNQTTPSHNITKPNTANMSFVRTADVLTTQNETYVKPTFEFGRNQSGNLIVSYFYSPHCTGHIAAAPVILNMKEKYKQYDWREYDITTYNGMLAYLQFAEQYNESKDKRLVPQILVNGKILQNSENIQNQLESLLKSQ